ncbi:MAG TPA: hypothetical protein VF415_04560, partial [Rhodanobacter sp.]
MRYVAPARDAVDPQVFGRMPLAAWREHVGLLEGRDWPSIDALNAARPAGMRERFAAQTHNGMPRLLPYLDIPFQHASPRILKLMKRPGNIDKTL